MDEQPNIDPNRLYKATDVARFLDLHPDSVYRIPPFQLPRVRVGPRGGATRFRGADVLLYLAPSKE